MCAYNIHNIIASRCRFCSLNEWHCSVLMLAYFDAGAPAISSYRMWWSAEGGKISTTDYRRSVTQSCTDSER